MRPLRYPREMLEEVFQQRNAELSQDERDLMFTLVDTVFFASLMIEEGDPVRVAIVHNEGGAAGLSKVVDASPKHDEEPPEAWDVTEIDRRPFEVAVLARLSRGLEYGVQLIVVGGSHANHLWIDGIARRSEQTDGGNVTRIAAPRPGVLVFERRYSEVLRFEAGQRAPSAIDVLGTDGPARVAMGRITGDSFEGNDGFSFTESALRRLLRKMRATGAGAILAMLPIVPDEATLREVRYRRVDPMLLKNRITDDKKKRFAWLFEGFGNSNSQLSEEQVSARDAKRAAADQAADALDAAIDDLARLSAIDGAVLAGPGLQVYGAGYIIPVHPNVDVVRALDARIRNVVPYPLHHGARHKAAFSFAWSTPGGVAFVISEDGPISCAWRDGDRVVAWSVRVSET